MVTVSNTGMTGLIMRDNGATTKPKDKELFGMLKVMSTKVNLKMTWLTDMESTLI